MTTKESILYESLKLFSTNGYDAVSTRMIARAINASDTVIYKHFDSKQEIFDTIVKLCHEKFETKRNEVSLDSISWQEMEKVCLDRYEFLTKDEWIVMFRKLLLVEQFKNPEMGKLYKDIFIDYPIKATTEHFRKLINKGYMKDGDPKVYAIELYAPFFLYSNESEISEETKNALMEHVVNFRRNVVDGIESNQFGL
ncbi:MAG: TetR/AcrR family transcriptional regulator [Eubacteriales bacterium]|nr:TetR/AcrR family transcriptional regulator [Eubacteriales bacterium]